MAGARQERANLVPDPRWLGGAAEQHDRRAATVPRAVRKDCPVTPQERATIERARRLLASASRKVERECCERDRHDEHEQREHKSTHPATKPNPAPRSILSRAHSDRETGPASPDVILRDDWLVVMVDPV